MMTPLQPFVLPFQQRLIDEHGQLREVVFPNWKTYHKVTPGVVFDYSSTSPTIEKRTIACAERVLEYRPIRRDFKPRYIGRGMIRLNTAEELRDDIIVDLELNILDNPNRTFAGVEWCTHIFDDESYALVPSRDPKTEPRAANGEIAVLVRPDGTCSEEPLRIILDRLNLHCPAGIGLAQYGQKGPYLFDQSGYDDRFAGMAIMAITSEGLIAQSRDFTLYSFDRDLNEIARIEGTTRSQTGISSCFVTASNRIVVMQHMGRGIAQGAKVYSLDGALLHQDPEFTLRGFRFHTQDWYLSGNAQSGHTIYNANIEPVGRLPAHACKSVRLSPDGHAFSTDAFGLEGDNSRLFEHYAPTGELLNQYSVEPPELRSARIQDAVRWEQAQADKRAYRNLPSSYFVTETLYAANRPHGSEKLSYRQAQISNGPEPQRCWIIIVPVVEGMDACPVCGITWDGYPYEDNAVDICPNCMHQPSCDDYPYDPDLDRYFGGQHGRYRKEWLDKSGWKQEDLDRIERVFQIDTSEWPRSESVQPE